MQHVFVIKQDYRTIQVPYGMPCMAYANCRSLAPEADDIVVVFLRRVARKAGGGGVLADHRSARVARGQAFEAPAAGFGKPLTVLFHCAEHFALALGNRFVSRGGF